MLAVAMWAGRGAGASTFFAPQNCTGPVGALACRLDSVLHFLYVTAAILAFLLLVVIAVAVRIYRQNSRLAGKQRL